MRQVPKRSPSRVCSTRLFPDFVGRTGAVSGRAATSGRGARFPKKTIVNFSCTGCVPDVDDECHPPHLTTQRKSSSTTAQVSSTDARFRDVVFDCRHAPSLSRFWAAALDGYSVAPYGPGEDPETDTSVLVESSDGHARLWFQQVPESKVAKNRVHLDVVCDDVTAEVERLVALGAAVVAARANLPHGLVSMRDPEGNEFCVSQEQGGSRERFALSAAVYAVRADGKVLLLRRADGGALAGQYFVPGGKVESGELPIDGAARELFEESGLVVDELLPVGSFPMVLSGRRSLALTYWGKVVDPMVVLSDEHTAYQWVDPSELGGLLTDETIGVLANGRSEVVSLLEHIRDDRHRFLAIAGRVGRRH